jgi:hypothetical protein
MPAAKIKNIFKTSLFEGFTEQRTNFISNCQIFFLENAMKAATTVVLRRARISVRKPKDQELYPSCLPDKKEWLTSHEIEMLMLDGYESNLSLCLMIS